MKKILIGVHNLSNSLTSVTRTGIQETVFQYLKACINHVSKNIQLIPIIKMLGRNKSLVPLYHFTHYNCSLLVFEKSLHEIGVSLDEFVLRFPIYKNLKENFESEDYWDTIYQSLFSESDAYFETALCDIRHLYSWSKQFNPNLQFGTLVYDFGPTKHPEYVDHGMDSWFNLQCLQNFRQMDFLISISRHTALDWNFLTSSQLKINQSNWFLSLPSGFQPNLAKPGLEQVLKKYFIQKPYFISVATLEPRKNIENVIRGFDFLCRILLAGHSEKPFLVLTGGKGWKNESLSELLKTINNPNIILTGYVTNLELDLLVSAANSLCMPSHYEGFGLPIGHARSLGTPSITSVNSSLPEAAGLEGCFVKPFSSEEIGYAMLSMLNSAREKKNDNETIPSTFPAVTPRDWTEYFECFETLMLRELNHTHAPLEKSRPLHWENYTSRILLDVSVHSLLVPKLTKQFQIKDSKSINIRVMEVLNVQNYCLIPRFFPLGSYGTDASAYIREETISPWHLDYLNTLSGFELERFELLLDCNSTVLKTELTQATELWMFHPCPLFLTPYANLFQYSGLQIKFFLTAQQMGAAQVEILAQSLGVPFVVVCPEVDLDFFEKLVGSGKVHPIPKERNIWL